MSERMFGSAQQHSTDRPPVESSQLRAIREFARSRLQRSSRPHTGEAPAYRTTFNTPSLGTEQELYGARIAMPPGESTARDEVRRGLIGRVWSGNEVVAEVATDIGGEELWEGTNYLQYTLEIKTTPTEADDAAGWAQRRRAVAGLVTTIDAIIGSESGSARLPKDAAGTGFTFEQVQDHRIFGSGDDRRVTGTSDQATIGIRSEDIASAQGGGGHVSAAAWFEDFSGDLADAALGKPELAGRLYSFVVSAMNFLAQTTQRQKIGLAELGGVQGYEAFDKNLYDTTIKDDWGLLPRTAPIAALDVLGTDRSAVVAAIAGRPAPFGTDAQVWAAAKVHILHGQSLAGSTQQRPTIGGGAGSLFEFRGKPPVGLRQGLHIVVNDKEKKPLDVPMTKQGAPDNGGWKSASKARQSRKDAT